MQKLYATYSKYTKQCMRENRAAVSNMLLGMLPDKPEYTGAQEEEEETDDLEEQAEEDILEFNE